MQDVEERRLRRMNNTPQGGTIEDNAADDILMVDQGLIFRFFEATFEKAYLIMNLYP